MGEISPIMLQDASVQHGDHAHADLHVGNMDTLKRKHERLIRSAQLKMLRLIFQSKRKYKIKKGRMQIIDEELKKDEDNAKDKEEQHNSENETTLNTDCDQDSDVSLSEDIDEEIDKMEIEEEDWIEYIERSTREAEEQMKKANIP